MLSEYVKRERGRGREREKSLFIRSFVSFSSSSDLINNSLFAFVFEHLDTHCFDDLRCTYVHTQTHAIELLFTTEHMSPASLRRTENR